MEKVKSLKLNAFLNILKTATKLIFPLITFPYVSRILLPTGTGAVNFANSIVSYFGIIAGLGISTYGLRGVARTRADKTFLSQFVKEVLAINLISTVISYLLFFLSILISSKLQEYKQLLCICSSNILLTTLGIEWLYMGLEEYAYITVRSIIFQIISFILIFTLVKKQSDYVIYSAISIFSSAGSNICNLIHAQKYVSFFQKTHLKLKQHLLPIFILFASSVAISVFTILDTSMLGFFSTNEEVGFYSAASKITRMVRDIFPAVTTVLFARISFYISKNDNKSVIEIVSKTVNFLLCLSFPIATGLFILMQPVVLLLCGETFLPAIKVCRGLVPLIILSACSGFLGGQIIIAKGKDRTYLFVVSSAAIIDVILNILLIPHYAAFGAAVATLITEFIIFITYLILTRQILKEVRILKNLLQYAAASFIMGIIVYLLSIVLKCSTIYLLLICFFSGAIVYALCLILFRNSFLIATMKELVTKTRN